MTPWVFFIWAERLSSLQTMIKEKRRRKRPEDCTHLESFNMLMFFLCLYFEIIIGYWSRKSGRLRVCICMLLLFHICIFGHVAICMLVFIHICIFGHLAILVCICMTVFVFLATLPSWWRKWDKRKVSPQCGLACARSTSPGNIYLNLINCIYISICDI